MPLSLQEAHPHREEGPEAKDALVGLCLWSPRLLVPNCLPQSYPPLQLADEVRLIQTQGQGKALLWMLMGTQLLQIFYFSVGNLK